MKGTWLDDKKRNFVEELEEESIKAIGKNIFYIKYEVKHGTFTLWVYVNNLQSFQIKIIEKHYKDQWLISNDNQHVIIKIK